MGQKVNPHGARVGVIKDWSARWYANKKDFSNYLVEDHALRTMLKEKLFGAGISHIDIERASNKVTVNIFTAKPGIVIGRGGAGAEALKKEIEAFTGKAVSLNILEIKQPEADAQLVAEKVAQSLEKRVSFRRAMKQSLALRCAPAPRESRCRSPAAWAARKSRGPRGIMRVPSRCRPCARTSITALPKPAPPMAALALRCGFTRVRCFPAPRRPPSSPRREESKSC